VTGVGLVEKIKKNKIKYLSIALLVVAVILGGLAFSSAAVTPLHDEAPGTVITFSGKQWIILEQMPNGETYVLLNDRDCQRAFDPDNTNSFDPSDSNNVGYYLNNTFFNSLSQKELIADHSWDRVSVKYSDRLNGTDFGNVSCKVGLLSYREYEKYSTYYNGNILPSNYYYVWWTRTSNTESSNAVFSVAAQGSMGAYNAFAANSVRPALYLKSGILISSSKEVVGVPPVAPANLISTSTSNQINLSWQANSEGDVAGYKIYRDNSQIAEVNKTLTAYSDNLVLPGTTYIYKITAFNTDGLESGFSTPVTVTTPPVTPTNLNASASGKDVTLTWQGEGNLKYIVQRSLDGVSFTQVAEVSQKTYTETASTWGVTYYYRVAQKGQDGQVSDFTNSVQVEIDPVPVPTGLNATAAYNNITLTWEGNTSGYLVQRSLDGSEWNNITDVTKKTHTDNNLNWGTTYHYRVIGKHEDGSMSEPSIPVTVTTDNVPVPTNLKAYFQGTDVVLTWEAVPYVNNYIVEKSSDGTTWGTLAEVTGSTTYTDMGLDLTKDHYYRVKADGGNKVSDPSNVVKASNPPAAPTDLQGSANLKSVSLAWQGADDVSFVLERSVDGQEWVLVTETIEPTYLDKVPRWDTTYYYRLFAKNADGILSEPSAMIEIQVIPIPAPSGLTANVTQGNTINLNWTGVEGVGIYRVERKGLLFWGTLGDVDRTWYIDPDLEFETTYEYRVRSLDGDQLSEPSEIIEVETGPALPATPKITCSVDNEEISISWNDQKVCDGYRVYINNELYKEFAVNQTSTTYIGERGKTYLIKVEAYNSHGQADAVATVTISQVATPGAGEMVGGVIENSGLIIASTGGLLALGLALKGSPILIEVVRKIFFKV
jgi:fibronectin type 3 domain-containing protein